MITIDRSKISTPAEQLELTLPGVWSTLKILDIPASSLQFNSIARPEPESQTARNLRLGIWTQSLNDKLQLLSHVNPEKNYQIQFDPDTKQQALFERTIEGNLIKRMWDGDTISTESGVPKLEPDGRASLDIFPIKYSEWTCCSNREYSFLNPSMCGLGISVLMETTDGFIPLTRRGLETPVYPGRLYSPGGGPKPGEKAAAALLSEILEETGLIANTHFDPKSIVILAAVNDDRHQGSLRSRPELIAYLPLKINAACILDIRDEAIRKKKTAEPDVFAMEFISSRETDLRGYVTLHGGSMCPPTEAAIVHLLRYKLQNSDPDTVDVQLSSLISRMRNYERLPFEPPIKLLAR